MSVSRNDLGKGRIVRCFPVAVLLQAALLLSASSPALSQDLASAGDLAVEHVRHLRSRKAVKPILKTDDDKPEPEDAVETAPAATPAAKPALAETTKAPAPRPKKVAAKPAAAKPAVAKQRAVVAQEASRPAPTPSAAPASRGFLEDIFGDN